MEVTINIVKVVDKAIKESYPDGALKTSIVRNKPIAKTIKQIANGFELRLFAARQRNNRANGSRQLQKSR